MLLSSDRNCQAGIRHSGFAKTTIRRCVEGGRYVLQIPPDGILRTSSAEQYGWASDQYFYYSTEGLHSLPDSGQSGLVWGTINGEESGASGKRKYEDFFVGTAQQFKDQVKKEKKAE